MANQAPVSTPSEPDPHEIAARLTPARMERLRAASSARMDGIAVVLDGLYDPGNRAAVYRAADGLGLLNMHICRPEASRKLHARAVSRGAEKWLRIHYHRTPADAARRLHELGYLIYTSRLDAAAVPVTALDFSRPVALVFGNEHEGVHPDLHAQADGAFVLPMRGMVESFNISTAAAMALHWARLMRARAVGAETDMPPEAREALLMDYVRQNVGWLRRVKSKRDGLVVPSGGDPD